jgi:hypothetical protein
MNRTTAFLLLVRKDEAGAVVQLQVALDRPTFDKDGQVLVTSDGPGNTKIAQDNVAGPTSRPTCLSVIAAARPR